MPSRPNILLVDDDERLRTAVSKVLTGEGHRVVCAASGGEALDLLKTQRVALVVSDLRLPDLDGIALLKGAREAQPEVEVVVITGHGSVEKAVEAMRLGAYDFIEKPIDSAALLKAVAKALEKQRLASENRQLRRQLQQGRSLDALIGDSPAMLAVKKLIRQIAPANVTVLIQGESGTGKEIVADAIHSLSDRAAKPLLKISCAAIPETLLESELFGYERGAFTGAAGAKPGKFELADGGTLLLDEIAEMSPPLQAKLLRVLQDGAFQRLGGTQNLKTDARLLTATHEDIVARIAGNQFRHDLYYRINTVQVSLPALRERRQDIPLLARHFLAKFCCRNAKRGSRHCARRDGPIAGPPLAGQRARTRTRHSTRGGTGHRRHDQRALRLPRRPPARLTQPRQPSMVLELPFPSAPPWTRRPERLVAATLEQCGGNKLEAARILGIPPRTMYRRFRDPKA